MSTIEINNQEDLPSGMVTLADEEPFTTTYEIDNTASFLFLEGRRSSGGYSAADYELR